MSGSLGPHARLRPRREQPCARAGVSPSPPRSPRPLCSPRPPRRRRTPVRVRDAPRGSRPSRSATAVRSRPSTWTQPRAGVEVLRQGGNAADAAVAAAATLGVTEPFSSGLGGGGYFVYYDARTHRVSTIDGRETGPAAFRTDIFVDPATGQPYPFATAVTSGLSVGVPGTPATWQTVAKRFGTKPVSAAAAAGDPGGAARLRRRPDVPRPGRLERRPVRQVQLDERALPARRSAARRRQRVQEPRPRGHLPPARAARASTPSTPGRWRGRSRPRRSGRRSRPGPRRCCRV